MANYGGKVSFSQKRYGYKAMFNFATEVLKQAGASTEVASDTAKYLLEGDLLGQRTHGLKRLYFNAKLLASGHARAEGHAQVLSERSAVATWDADFLPGPYIAAQAVHSACDMARVAGTATIIVRRAQHVASLAAYLRIATEQGLLISLMCSTPAQSSVAPFGGRTPVFSPNPFAIGVPSSGSPILLDMSFSMTAAGKIRQYWERGEALPWAAIINTNGDLSSNPADYINSEESAHADSQPPAIMPLGGADLGYKGYGLCLMSEIWTMALSNYGRLHGAGDGESNTLFVQVLDPAAFGDPQECIAVTDDLIERCKTAVPLDSKQPVRIPGSQAMQQRTEQLNNGVKFDEATLGRLQRAAERFQVHLPEPLISLAP